MKSQQERQNRRQLRNNRRQLSSSSYSRGGVPSFSLASPSLLSVFVAAVIVSPSGLLHQANAAKVDSSKSSPLIQINTNTDSNRRLKNNKDHGDNNSKGKYHNDNKHGSKWDKTHRGTTHNNVRRAKHGKAAKSESEEAIEEIVTAMAELEQLDVVDHGDTTDLELGLEEMAEDLIAATFPAGCSWECYLANYPLLGSHVGNTEAAALENWVKEGEWRDRDCRCQNAADIAAAAAQEPAAVEEEVVKNIEIFADKIEELEGENDTAAAVEKLVLTAVEEELIEVAEDLVAATFPEGCSWGCYLANYPLLGSHVGNTEAAALENWVKEGDKRGRDCRCQNAVDVTASEAQEPAAMEEEAEIVESIEIMGEQIEVLEGENDNAAVAMITAEQEDLIEMAEDLIAATFPEGCSWGCYLANYPRLGSHVGNTEAAALENWVKEGQGRDRDCRCQNAAVAETEEVVENIENMEEQIEELKGENDNAAVVEKLVLTAAEEELIEVAEDLIAATFPEGCSWECYLANYPLLGSHVGNTEAAALENWVKEGQGRDRNCRCQNAAVEDAEEVIENIENMEEQIEELEGDNDNAAVVEKLVLAAAEEKLIEVAEDMIVVTFPEGCSWECYLTNYPRLGPHVGNTEAAALENWVKEGEWRGRNCRCQDATDSTVSEVREREAVEEEEIVEKSTLLSLHASSLKVWLSATVFVLAFWAVRRYKSSKRGGGGPNHRVGKDSSSDGHVGLADESGMEKPPPAEYRDMLCEI